MGLLLYQAPVESDIQSKSATGKALAEARSSIRRYRLTRGYDVREQVRERRRRAIAEAAILQQPRRRSPTVEGPAGRSATENANALLTDHEAFESGRRVLQDVASRIGGLNDQVVAMFGGTRYTTASNDALESLRQLQDRGSRSRSRSRNTTRGDASTEGLESVILARTMRRPDGPTSSERPDRLTRNHNDETSADRLASSTDHRPFYSRGRYTAHLEPYTLSDMRSTQDPHHQSRSSTTSPATAAVPAVPAAPPFSTSTTNLRRHIWDGLLNWRAPSATQTDENPPSLSTNRLDGLGDRSRSLSPEGDNAWDTLLTTLTPDPQPPSVGSSFASASASAAATQNTVAASSATSLANLDTTAEDQNGAEPPCESGYDNDNSDMEEDDEDELPGFILPSLRVRRIDGTNTDDALDLMGGSEVIQHLVRSLARREDIPDEWWAQVGLSRTLSREASAD